MAACAFARCRGVWFGWRVPSLRSILYASRPVHEIYFVFLGKLMLIFCRILRRCASVVFLPSGRESTMAPPLVSDLLVCYPASTASFRPWALRPHSRLLVRNRPSRTSMSTLVTPTALPGSCRQSPLSLVSPPKIPRPAKRDKSGACLSRVVGTDELPFPSPGASSRYEFLSRS